MITAPSFTSGQVSEGAAFVYSGKATGLSSVPTWTVHSNIIGRELGTGAAGVGDINGDGYNDVVVSTPNYGNVLGIAWIYLGSATGLSNSPAWTSMGRPLLYHYWRTWAGGPAYGFMYVPVTWRWRCRNRRG